MNTDNTTKAKNETEVSIADVFKRFLKSFKKFWWVSATLAVTFAVASFIYFSATFIPQYRSDVKFTIMPLVSGDASNGASVYSFNYNQSLAEQMANTFPHIVSSGIMNDIVINDLQRPFSGTVSAEAVANTNIFEVSVSSSSAQDAYDILNSIIRNYPKVAEYIIGDTRMTVIEGAEPKVATVPYNSGSYYKYVVFAAFVGVLIGAGVAFIDMRYRKVILNRDDIELQFNGKCICEIPAVRKKRGHTSGNILKAGPSVAGFSESIRVLKQRVRNAIGDNKTKIIGITSAKADEGKTTVAYNLSRALSNGEQKVLLIDMNFGNRDIQNILNSKKAVSNVGITDVVAGKQGLNDVINSVSNTLDVIFAGEENIKFIIADFAPVFEQVKAKYDYIIVDMPTCGAVSETVQIADLCDEILFVTRVNAVSPEKVYNALKELSFSNVKLMGFVLNGVDENNNRHYYGRYGKRYYGYGYSYGYSRKGEDYLYGSNK